MICSKGGTPRKKGPPPLDAAGNQTKKQRDRSSDKVRGRATADGDLSSLLFNDMLHDKITTTKNECLFSGWDRSTMEIIYLFFFLLQCQNKKDHCLLQHFSVVVGG